MKLSITQNPKPRKTTSAILVFLGYLLFSIKKKNSDSMGHLGDWVS